MKIVPLILQIVVALGLLNVWLLRCRRPTGYRGGSANSLLEEFRVYGLPDWFFWVVGAAKLSCAVGLLIGIWWPVAVLPSAACIEVLMLGALAMHLKVRDPLVKSLPAATMLVLVSVVLANAF